MPVGAVQVPVQFDRYIGNAVEEDGVRTDESVGSGIDLWSGVRRTVCSRMGFC